MNKEWADRHTHAGSIKKKDDAKIIDIFPPLSLDHCALLSYRNILKIRLINPDVSGEIEKRNYVD